MALIEGADAGKKTNPQVWWLDGKAYYSAAAYQKAVAAKATAQAAQSRGASEDRALHSAQLRTNAIARAKAAQGAVSEAAASEALSRAAKVRGEQELARIQARQQQELQRAAQLRAARVRELVMAGRTDEARSLLVKQQSEQREVQRRASEARRAAARHEAYEALQAQMVYQRKLAEAHRLRDAREVERIQEERARELQSQEGRFVATHGGFQEGLGDSGGMRFEAGTADQRRNRVIKEAESTGDWSSAVELLNQQSLESGGRYVDEKLMEAVNAEYVAPVIQVGEDYEQAINEAKALLDAENLDGLQALIDSKEFAELESLFAEYFGDGRRPGSFAAHAQMLTAIAQRRERLWTGLMLDPSGNTTSEEDIQALLDKAQRESQVDYRSGGLQEGADFAGRRDLTFTDYVTNAQTGERERVVRSGMDAYLSREAARRQDQQIEQYQAATQRLRNIRMTGKHKTGRPMAASYQDGQLVTTDIRQQQALDEMFALVPDGETRFEAIVNAPNPATREVLITNLMRDVEGAWSAAHRNDPVDAVPAPTGNTHQRGTIGITAGNRAEQMRFMTEIKRALLGPAAGSYNALDQLSTTYGLGDLFRGAGTVWAMAGSGLRQARAEWFGDFNKPSFDIRLWGDEAQKNREGEWNLGPLHFGTEVLEDGRQQYEDFRAGLASDNADVRAAAQRSYGLGIVGGNAGWALEGLADPLNAVSPAAWLNRARLAIAAAGGGRAAFASLGGAELALYNYARYSAPKVLGGFGSSKLRTDLAKMALARELKLSSTEVLRMADSDLKELADRAARGAEDLRASDAFQRLLERSDIDQDQLLNIIQDRLPAIGREFRLNAVDPFEMQARIRAVREGFERAERQAVEAAELEARRIAQLEAAEALERVRVQAGQKVARSAALTADAIAEDQRLLKSYLGATSDYAAVAKRAAHAADQLDQIAQASTKPDHSRMVTVYAQMKTALDDMARYEDQFTISPEGTRELTGEGLVTQTYRQLSEYRLQFGGDPYAPRFQDLAWQQVKQDQRMLVSRIRGLQRSLKAAKNEDDIANLRLRLTEAHKARAGVAFEAAALDPRGTARTYATKHIDRVKPAAPTGRIGQKALNEAERHLEGSRDLSNRIGQVAKVREAAPLSDEVAEVVSRAQEEIGMTTGRHVKEWAEDLISRKPGARFGRQAAGDALEALERLAADLGLPLADIPIEDLMVALYRVNLNAVDKEAWFGAFKLVEARFIRILRAAGWRDSVEDYIRKVLADAHIRAERRGGLELHEAWDRSVADALFQLRKFRAKGQLRGSVKRYKPADEFRNLLRPDTDPAEVLTKIRVLREQGIDIFEYDASRGVLMDVILRRNSQEGLLREAQEIALKRNIPLDEAYLAARDRRAEIEALRLYENFAALPENRFRAPAQVLRLFEEKYVGRDLGRVADLEVTSYQMGALHRAWSEMSGFDYRDEHLRRAYLSGQPLEFPAGARRIEKGEYIIFEEADLDRIRIVPEGHYKLDAEIPFGRGRDDFADQEMILESEVDDLASAAGELTEGQAANRVGRSSRRNWAEAAPSADSGVTTRKYGSLHMFRGTKGQSVKDYRRWLWEKMNSDPLFRRELAQLYYRDKGAVWRGLRGREGKSATLAQAAQWMARSPQAKARWAKNRLVPHHSASGFSWAERRWREGLQRDLVALQGALKEARDVAGVRSHLAVPKRWLLEIREALQEKLGIAVEHKGKLVYKDAPGSVEAARISRAIGGEELSGHDLRGINELLRTGNKVTTDPIPMSELARLRDLIDDIGIASVGDLISGVKRGKVTEVFRPKWIAPEGFDWTSIAGRRITGYEERLAAIRKQLEDGFPESRQRGRVGLSVAGDGVYIREGTSNVTLAHEIFHQFWDDIENTSWRIDIERAIGNLGHELRTELWERIRVGSQAYDEAEFAAELYALWRVGESVGSDVRFAWHELRALLAQGDQGKLLFRSLPAFDALGDTFRGFSPKISATPRPPHSPPLHNRSLMRAWLVENGYWSPRTGDQIASGERVWSVDEERGFFERNWGYTPPWTDAEVLRPLLADQRALKVAMQEWGFFEGGFEQVAAGMDLTSEELLGAVVWGQGEFGGKRTLAEMRQWAVQRYGDLAGTVDEDGAIHLTSMPWLMKADDEYFNWMTEALSESGVAARRADWEAARARLPKVLRDAIYDGDEVSRFGLEINRGLVKPKEIEKLNAALVKASRRRLERLVRDGDLDPGDWLPKEQLAFAYDVANELLADPVWRGLLRGTPVAGAVLHVWSQFWRMLVSWSVAFPVMNLIESFGYKRLYLTIYENGWRPLSLEDDGARLIRNLEEIHADSSSLFYLADAGKPVLRLKDKTLPLNIRGGAAIKTVLDAPLQISKFGENQLRLDFARAVAGRTYRAAVKSGMAQEAAESLARYEAKRMINAFFAMTHGSSGFARMLNQLVPFFSYNFKNKTLAVRTIWQHPAIILWGQRLERAVKDANRRAWEEQNPGVPFPEDEASSSWLWFQVGEDFYKIDLAAFSDWTRALASVTQSQNAGEWVTEFLRVPHPSQQGMLAWLTQGTTPWGKPGHIREMSPWADLLFWMNGSDYQQIGDKRDWIQMASQMLFFKKFGIVTPLKAKIQQYYWFRSLDPGKAASYLAENDDLGAYFSQLSGTARRPAGATQREYWKERATEDEIAAYESASEEWQALNRALDARIFEFANEPWSEEYKTAKREASIARAAFLRANPILPDTWGVYMSAAEFAGLREGWIVDELQDSWYTWERPRAEDFKTELAHQQAMVQWYEDRTEFLKANPALAERLLQGRTAIETAWREQELHWSSILEFQAKLKVRILEEQEKPDAAQDQEFIDLMYRIRDAASLELDGEDYTQAFGAIMPGRDNAKAIGLVNMISRTGSGLIRRVAQLPGFSDAQYANASPSERRQMRADDRFFRGMKEIGDRIAKLPESERGKAWYDAMRSAGLLDEYFERNPDKKAIYDANQEYVSWMGRWIARMEAGDFDGSQAVWDAMPSWVKERYFAAHPDSKMRDGMGGGGVEYNGQFFKSTESRQRFIQGQEYYAAMGRWVKLLQAKEYVAADRFFRTLPGWIRERYYAAHPERRAENELDSEILREGAEYFLATGDDKLKILQKYPQLRAFLAEHGGDEGAYRGLINAMYRAIPSSEAWLKRTFRERFPEIFSQEAAGERRLADVAGELARNPEMLPFYEKAYALQSQLYLEQLKRSKQPPRPLAMERKRRLKKRSKRRAARMHSAWTLHNDLRKNR